MNNERPSGIHRVLSDVATLAELQLQLLSVEGREAGRRGLGAMLFIGMAGAVLISAVTVALLGFGWLLHEEAGWSVGWSLLAMAALALILTGGILLLAYLSAKKASAALQETGAEFAENLRWLRSVVSSTATSRRPTGSPPYPEAPYTEAPFAPPPGSERMGAHEAAYSRSW